MGGSVESRSVVWSKFIIFLTFLSSVFRYRNIHTLEIGVLRSKNTVIKRLEDGSGSVDKYDTNCLTKKKKL